MNLINEHDKKLIQEALRLAEQQEKKERNIILKIFRATESHFLEAETVYNAALKAGTFKAFATAPQSPLAKKMFIAGYLCSGRLAEIFNFPSST